MGSRCTITAAANAFARLTFRYLVAVVVLSLAAMLTSCGAAAPTPPTATSPGAPIGPVVNIAGTWTGTFASANFPTQTITMMVYQATNCVDGAWSSGSSDWAGSISGYAGEASYSGRVSFERPSGGDGKCLASGTISGAVTGNTLHWTAASLTPIGTCVGDLPRSIVIDLQRQ
jgi:hypothetical protein